MCPIANPDDGAETLYAEPGDLDALELFAAHEEQTRASNPRLNRHYREALARRSEVLRSKMVEAHDAPKLDARDWPAAPGLCEQFVENVENLYVPPNRLRQLRFSDGRIVYEAWTPLPRALAREEIHLAANGQIPIGRWRLSYHVYAPEWCTCPRARLQVHPHGLIHPECGRLKKPKVEGAFDEHVRSLQLQVDDEAIYNGYYPTIPGDDIAHFDGRKNGMAAHQGGDPILRVNPEQYPNGKIVDPYLRGGTEIRGGRAEHRQLTRNATELGPGSSKEWEKQEAEKKRKRKAAERLKIEKAIQKGPRQIGEL